ncbi:uncharacterized protein [Choristoneura fumiferana]|uniref:uncharacterized protein n=1 Tax=Choristoneura fumiferana TaxID=7141 RepID=UPI003D15A75F
MARVFGNGKRWKKDCTQVSSSRHPALLRGLFVCLACRGARRRAAALATLLVAATVVVAAHTYFQDLDAVVIQSPEKYRNLYATDDTFRLLYSRGHTNLSTYVLGLAAGFLTYHWQQEGKDMSRFKKYRWFVWLCFPWAWV